MNPAWVEAEGWHPVVGYERHYIVSRDGRVMRVGDHTSGTPMYVRAGADGFHTVSLCKDRIRRSVRVALLVAEAFDGLDSDAAIAARPVPVVLSPIDGETWADIPGYEGLYRVSTLGRVVSCGSTFRGRFRGNMGTRINGKGYRSANLTDASGKKRAIEVHRLVALTFLGPPVAGMEVRHIDGNRANPALTNLAWGTRRENAADRTAHGNTLRGEQVGISVLTEEKVRQIRALYVGRRGQRPTYADMAARFGCSMHTVALVVQGRTWAHVKSSASS